MLDAGNSGCDLDPYDTYEGMPEPTDHDRDGRGRAATQMMSSLWTDDPKHELERLMPLVAPGGALALDDYGHWPGVGRPVDEHLEKAGTIAAVPGLQASASGRGRHG